MMKPDWVKTLPAHEDWAAGSGRGSRGRCRVGSQRSVNSGDVMRARWRKGELPASSGVLGSEIAQGWGAGLGFWWVTGAQRGQGPGWKGTAEASRSGMGETVCGASTRLGHL